MPKTIFDHTTSEVFADDIGVEQESFPEDFITEEELEEEEEEEEDDVDPECCGLEECDEKECSLNKVIAFIGESIAEIREDIETMHELLRSTLECMNSLVESIPTPKPKAKPRAKAKPKAKVIPKGKARRVVSTSSAKGPGKPGRPVKEPPKVSARRKPNPSKKTRR